MTYSFRAVTEPVPGQANEDAVFSPHLDVMGVFDGVTRPSGLDTGCVHSVAWYVGELHRGLITAIDDQRDAPLADLLAAAIEATRAAHGGLCDLDNPSTPAATVALIRPTEAGIDYLVLCDAFIVYGNGTDVEVITDSRFETAISRVRARHLTGAPFGSQEHAEQFRLAGLEKQHLTNNEDGYWIAAATPEAAHHAITGTLPHGIRRLALLTDGATRAVDVFGLFGWRELLDIVTEDGPQELIRQVRKAEHQDAAGTEQPRFKRHDDATVILCTLDETT